MFAWICILLGLSICIGIVYRSRHPDPDTPLPPLKQRLGWFVGGLFCCLVGYLNLPAVQARHAAAEQERLAVCRTDLQCWADEHQFFAERRCQEALEQRAKYGAEWMDGPMFTSALNRWKDQDRGHLSYFGDQLRFQNVFGTFQRVWYRCDYAPERKQVLQAQVSTPEEGLKNLFGAE